AHVEREHRAVPAAAPAVAASGPPDAPASSDALERPSIATLPPLGDHWVWVPDRLLEHSLLFDGDDGRVLGMIDSPGLLTPQAPLVSRDRKEIYSVDVDYARGRRGKRSDFVTVYDLETMKVKGEIDFPTRAGSGNTAIAYSALVGPRFLAVFNQFPASSVSIIDLERRRFVGEIGIAGCSGVYPVDELRFATLCGNGATAVVELAPNGRKRQLFESAPFFDPVEDPVFTSAGRIGARWIFVSFAGRVHDVDFSRSIPIASPPWSLTADAGDAGDWRPGGLQLVAVHASSGRLFIVMHRGGPGSHKDGGPAIWSFDLAAQKRLAVISPPAISATFLGGLLGVPRESVTATLMRWFVPGDEVHSIAVSQDARPVLFMRNAELGAVGVVDAENGAALRILNEAGLAGPTLRVP
ncbi:MAG: hypothetical protein KC616_25620, partial [Myxococcales bacterium]|nr:hypothetical protein [Myxococcales bacterium]